MSKIRLEAIKERLYMQRELRMLKGFQKRNFMPHRQGRIDYLVRQLNFSYMLFR